MTPQRYQRVMDVVEAAWERDTSERDEFLQEVCAGDAELRSVVETILASDEKAGEFLAAPAMDLVQDPAAEASGEYWAGRRLGPYRVLRELGRGAMGVVYLAERADGHYRKRVAIKLVNPQLGAEEILRRFRNERQVLAVLDHPNIAQLHDGGVTEEGLPYLVMEYVEGVRIDTWCDEHKLPVPHRVKLVRQVCAAVQYAHGQAVIHRDIKPGNILVTADGTPKLLDFGIAKVLDPGLSTELTGETIGPGPMTPEYASPEQVRGERVGPASDIYSLGVVLYRLLTGRLPYSRQADDLRQMMGAICEQEPMKPSAAIQRTRAEVGQPDVDTTAIVSEARGESPAGLRRVLAGDLDNIVLKALRKEPERRYNSVTEFSEDLDRFLRDLPVQARKDSLAYRGRKFLKRRRALVTTAALSAVSAAGFGVGLSYYLRSAPVLTEHDVIVLADITNTTGDTVFDGTLRQAVSVKLAESPFINTLSDDQMTRTLERMGRKATERVTAQLGREICSRNGLKAVVSGSIAQLGQQYILQLDATNCATGESLARPGREVTGKSQVLPALGKVSVELRARLGESLGSIQRFDKPFDGTSSSLEALQAYSMARKVRKGSRADYLALLKRSVELDPDFAYAYAALSAEYSNLKQTAKAYEYGRRAFEQRDKVTEREKFYLLDKYYGAVTGQIEERIQSAKLWRLAYPRDDMALASLSTAYAIAGQPEQALGTTLEALQANPDGVTTPWWNAMGFYAALGRFDAAKRIYEDAKKHKISNPHLYVVYYDIAFLRHDAAGMAEAVRGAMGKEGDETEILVEQSGNEAYSGRLHNARALLQRTIEAAQRTGDKPRMALLYAMRAHIEGLLGAKGPARQDARLALQFAGEYDIWAMTLAAWSLALAGDRIAAEAVGQSLQRTYPLHTIANRVYLPVLRAQIENIGNRPDQAIEALAAATPYELASSGATFGMYAVYVRGLANLRAHKGEAAAAEFQKVLDRPGIVMNSPISPLARLGLAQAYAIAGDRAKSRAAYQEFFTLWKDADADLPILAEARKQYGRLLH